jgi:hypothetical protein
LIHHFRALRCGSGSLARALLWRSWALDAQWQRELKGIPHRRSVHVADPPRTVDKLATPSIAGTNLPSVLAITPSRFSTGQFLVGASGHRRAVHRRCSAAGSPMRRHCMTRDGGKGFRPLDKRSAATMRCWIPVRSGPSIWI